MKDDKITVTGDDLDVSTWAACWPVNEIGGGQDGVIPIALGHLCRLWRETPLIKDVFHPVSYTVDCSLSSVQAKFNVCRLRMQILQFRNCACVAQSQDCTNSQIARNM